MFGSRKGGHVRSNGNKWIKLGLDSHAGREDLIDGLRRRRSNASSVGKAVSISAVLTVHIIFQIGTRRFTAQDIIF